MRFRNKKSGKSAVSGDTQAKQPSFDPALDLESKNKRRPTSYRHIPTPPRTVLVLAIIAIAAIVVIICSVAAKQYSTSEPALKNRLESYASEVYEENLKHRDSNSYTINLRYLKSNDYDVSIFESKGCSETDTYVIIRVTDDGSIDSMTTQLKCDESDNI